MSPDRIPGLLAPQYGHLCASELNDFLQSLHFISAMWTTYPWFALY